MPTPVSFVLASLGHHGPHGWATRLCSLGGLPIPVRGPTRAATLGGFIAVLARRHRAPSASPTIDTLVRFATGDTTISC